MSKLMNSTHSTINHNYNQRSHSVSPQRVPWTRACGRVGGLVGPGREGRHHSDIHRLCKESNSKDVHSSGGGGGGGGGPVAVNFTDKQYRNILRLMGQSVHIPDFNGRIVY